MPSNLRLAPIVGLTRSFTIPIHRNGHSNNGTDVSDFSRLLIQRGIHHHTKTPLSKVCSDAKTALSLSGLKDGDTVAVGKIHVLVAFLQIHLLIRLNQVPYLS